MNITGGVIVTLGGQRHYYLGVALGTYGFTVTGSLQSVTPGWNIAFSVAYGRGAIQVGTNLGCLAECRYIELGVGSPGVDLMVFYVW